ncbi:MAG: hypothetical protein CL512_04840 [Actinobacteria bacterium]|nr:hypothetical protein [Actinomycetota bacterium]
MGKITFNKVRGYQRWKIKSDGVFVERSFITLLGACSYVIEVNFHSLTLIDPHVGNLKLGKAETLEGAKDLAKEIFKNKTSLLNKSFESSIEYFSAPWRGGEKSLTPEKCSQIFFYLISDIDQRKRSVSD